MKPSLVHLLVYYFILGGGVTNLVAQPYQPKYLREQNKTFLALTTNATSDGWLDFRPDGEVIDAASFATRFAKAIGMGEGYSLQLVRDRTDVKETRHQHYQLYYKSLLVEGGHLTLHSCNGRLRAAHSRIIDGLDLAVDKAIPEQKALEIALTDRKLTLSDVREHLPKGVLVLANVAGDYAKENYRLTYYFDIYANGKDVDLKQIQEPSRVYVDATTGQLLAKVPLLQKCFNPAHHHESTETNTKMSSTRTQPNWFQPATFNLLYPRSNLYLHSK
ncbi:hypothetical protein GCM10028806_12570 [Spirosoma terrae]|uniref:FTP domain-containing protein n=1 Tax=Spirosoma terrae TaxID=1968276 RepID=A0A6L9L350_9BACT|nr:hypothetical protein [Spirosoma terrae]NDU94914.1 hypothetical protein [Spirosoma terrae]